MTRKWKIFGIQTTIEWYDAKRRFKKTLRALTYSWAFQQLICIIILGYMKLVYHTSRKVFINHDNLIEAAKNKKPLIVCFWHNRLMMIPFATNKPKKLHPDYNFMTLASRHGDGKFVGKIMEKLGLISIYGSSKNGRKTGRGIEMKNLKKIIKGLKSGLSLGVTPDGPRGPNQKINGEIVNIARMCGAEILAASYSSSRYKKLKTWDKFYIPLPFSTLCFYCDNITTVVPKDANEAEANAIKKEVEQRMNFVQRESEKVAMQK